MKNAKILMKGNIAVCEGAIAAGCEAYFGYPITPQNEIPAYMSQRMVELNRIFIQAESEVAAINMVFGAAVAGKRAMTSSSSPGISLKQEGISYLAGCELPCVIVNVQRGGPGLGNISGSQSDYFQATKGGGHGDYRLIVLAPNSVEEMFSLTFLGFDLADKYRNPTMILSDGIVGQMMEPIESIEDRNLKLIDYKKDWKLDGCKGRKPRLIRSLMMGEGELARHNRHLEEKYTEIKKNEIRYETDSIDDAEIVIVAFGISARICKAALRKLRQQGKKVGLIRPITLWPFPEKIIYDVSKKIKKILVVEMNLGQMVEDVNLSVKGNCPVEFLGAPGGTVFDEEEVISKIVKMQ
ncbi:MAG: 3-methyl-2-oxobutanoate dehydrogenase subunit VorB [Elusimicrobia bacterium RIFOXYC2_FULL_34_12]|nr:MAG: 3-methyl-2-oxobutanoate dehydrogenase subunit VorB [Elusimicrobia bacterium RIFOXYC2_FULL_34_12]OGS39691.1 MAG: 3-methyl-2-oxobutanoate dehydrogenase subunit VorB [Elusimicrobia bacterium RIFOXYD2_FULL_34_30]